MQCGTVVPGTGDVGSAGRRPWEEFGLSVREVEVMELIASGMSNRQIAATCFTSERP
jgi:DNA-binding CsgD family transcriptional regulator